MRIKKKNLNHSGRSVGIKNIKRSKRWIFKEKMTDSQVDFLETEEPMKQEQKDQISQVKKLLQYCTNVNCN